MAERIEVRDEIITPEMAKKYLTHNLVNRTINAYRVAAYAADMKNHKWQYNGEAIQFNKSGKLVNGQHRLSAIVKANVPVKMLVMRNVPDDVNLYDRGRNRSITDEFIAGGMDKKLASPTIVAIAKLHYALQLRTPSISDSEIHSFLIKYESTLRKMIDSKITAKAGRRVNNNCNTSIAPIQLAIFYALESGVDIEICKSFINVIKTGFSEGKNQSSAIVIRNDFMSNKFGNATYDRVIAEKCVEKALFDFVSGTARKLSYRESGAAIYSCDIRFKETR